MEDKVMEERLFIIEENFEEVEDEIEVEEG